MAIVKYSNFKQKNVQVKNVSKKKPILFVYCWIIKIDYRVLQVSVCTLKYYTHSKRSTCTGKTMPMPVSY